MRVLNGISLVLFGIALGATIIGLGLSGRINDCVSKYSAPCVVENTWTGTNVTPQKPNK